MKEKLTQRELDERIAILRKFRSLLEEQRAKFKAYLNVLEMQESKISNEDADALIAHSELETQIVQSIGSLQKVIMPMQELYHSCDAASASPSEALPIQQIQQDLELLQMQVLEQNEKNRSLLKNHIADLRSQMLNLKNPYKNRQSVYSQDSKCGTRVFINA